MLACVCLKRINIRMGLAIMHGGASLAAELGFAGGLVVKLESFTGSFPKLVPFRKQTLRQIHRHLPNVGDDDDNVIVHIASNLQS
jgi:hypothetical protein